MNRRYSIIYFMFLLLMISSCKDHDQVISKPKVPPIAGDQLPVKIEDPSNENDIRSAYTSINAMARKNELDSISKNYDCRGEKRGSVSYFSKEQDLQLVVHEYSEYDHYSAVDRYFVSNGKVFFIERRSVSWAFEDGAKGTTKDNVTETRLYITNGSAIKCLEKKYTIKSDSDANPVPEQIPNKEIDCKPAQKMIAEFESLVAFRSKSTDCPLN